MVMQKFRAAAASNRSTLCIGLDPDLARLPEHLTRDAAGIVQFNQAIIEATSDLVCAYKPNIAFYEALGSAGWQALKQTIASIPGHLPIILDAKRGDIGSTAKAYASAAFDELGVDAITLSPYMGYDSLQPFLERADKTCFILCRTSNPGGDDVQNLALANGEPLFLKIAELVAERWNGNQNCGLVVGATYPSEIATIHQRYPELPLLVPGVGSQGGDIGAVLAAAGEQAIINLSRSVLYASSTSSFAEAARDVAQRFLAPKQALNHP
ncbi:orotidine-5'-phosphate decarboxylase [Herpetosiphon geysericola]|uniref:Orotidine 5'-phosphate decarboxylase n=1 Tax=Herpetosiphon geysericola TaxID=70996 RepID=A0A0P6Y4E1_9CHLR|nr:orotidine-5'-phosphate decarboxylase [Herpetosiphon geysericola]KPL90940.1 orotidine 5'-phosphate decarboxylase [Herpetosiphon geysericola]